MPRVSVCIPTRNRCNLLTKTLATVFSQTYQSVEVLVCDDASSDQTYEMIKKSCYPTLKVFRNSKHSGYVESMNRLADLAEGEFIMFLSDDDLLLPTMIEKQVEVMDEFPNVGLVAPATALIDLKGRLLFRPSHLSQRKTMVIPGRKAIDNFLPPFRLPDVYKLYTSFPSFIFRRDIVHAIGKFSLNVQVACDLLIVSKFCLSTDIAYIPQPLFLYRIHNNWGSMMGRRGLYIEEFNRLLKEILAFARSRGISLESAWLSDHQTQMTKHAFSPTSGMLRMLLSFEGGYAHKARTIARMFKETLTLTPNIHFGKDTLIGLTLGLMIPTTPMKAFHRIAFSSLNGRLLTILLKMQ